MAENGWLIDITRCVGCRACQVACKRWNNRPGEETSFSNEWTNPHGMSSKTYTFMDFRLEGGGSDDEMKWRFVKRQCMHCNEPPCLSVCPTSAIYKRPDGAVLIHHERCIGCGYCVVACPYNARHYDEEVHATIKCTWCSDRRDEGELTACVQACPALVMQIGPRDEIIREARQRADKINGYVYGDEEGMIGTSVIYVSDVPMENLGFPTPEQRVPNPASLQNLLPQRAAEAIFGGAVAGIIGFILWRKSRIEKAQMEAISKTESTGEEGE